MYAAVARRTREVGVLRTLGFSRGSVLTSFMVESVILAAAGGVAGDLLAIFLGVAAGLDNRLMSVGAVVFSSAFSASALAGGNRRGAANWNRRRADAGMARGASSDRRVNAGSLTPMQTLHLVLRYLIRQPRRAVLTMLTFAVATFIFTVLAAIPESIDMIIKRTSETLRVYSYNADGRYLGVPARDCRTIEKIPGVVACNPMVALRATYQNASETVQAFALDADKVALMYPDYNLSPEVIEQFSNIRSAAVAGRILMRKHGWKVGDVVTLRADSNRLDIKFTMGPATTSKRFMWESIGWCHAGTPLSAEGHTPSLLLQVAAFTC